MSGGAHPILMNDDRLCDALYHSSIRGSISLGEARDYACDGCYEPMISGMFFVVTLFLWLFIDSLLRKAPLSFLS